MCLALEGEKSERLVFRKIVPSDFDSWLPFNEKPLSTKHSECIKKTPLKACETQFKSIVERNALNLGGMHALLNQKTKTFTGICGLLVQTVDDCKEIEIGYSILPKYWREGYATEAAKKYKQYAIKHKISIIHIDNTPSQKVAIANGKYLYKTTTYKNNPVHIYRITL